MKYEIKSIDDILRFLVTGYVIYAVAEYSGFKTALSVPRQLGSAEKGLIVFAAGAVTYFLFRTVVYPWLLQRMVVDRLNRKANVRSHIRKDCQINWGEANDIYHLVVQRHPDLPLDVDSDRLWSHSIYMLFISAGEGCRTLFDEPTKEDAYEVVRQGYTNRGNPGSNRG